ncbi:MAG: hypothetical protein COV74_01925 [Candidatus Omnitrophica bacterium CG11_big_fil_rev_8_21_14_0_20_45_26]|uniref:Type-4 uracil-DNA glycosylase n=1 Tax=Candidatus Abzuiibacterium crystallinum TaxID=1974748 RepID=A0A2H0LSI7_9BACT|nr:MAG: hypothetical protein COV74_01925 [Candidatus Omnitrophica bacterium CG11_big_fil_rev_8_21_14_0_20_45_26]PIW65055.1 MAG: hypothetical protein COW12_04205 [Candidatus Omnitrophica bacterium CG12_big_fil_rev_8_21_14_0_65_45_16]
MMKLSGVDELLLPSERHVVEEIVETASSPAPAVSSSKDELLVLSETVKNCSLCGELAQTRKQTVFGAGHAKAKLMFVGEAPGYDEDQQGLPFVGKAGQLLTKMIEAISLKRQEVFICNILKCRPPGNRNPLPDEVINCQPFLWQQIALIQPKIICALGKFAAQTILKTTTSISALRGQIHDYQGIKVICTFHPSYLLRNPADKKKAWEDLKQVYRELQLS